MTSSVRAPSVQFRLINATGDGNAVNGCPSVTLRLRAVLGDEERKEVTVCPPALSSITLGSLVPGMYDAYAGWNIGMNEGAWVSFEVRDVDLDLEVVVSRARLTGKIMFELPDRTTKPAENLQLVLSPKGAARRIEMKTAWDGTIHRDRLGLAQYTVSFPQLPPDAYIA